MHSSRDCVIVKVPEDQDIAGLSLLRDLIFQELRKREAQGLVLDLASLQTLDTACLTALAGIASGARLLGAAVAVCGIQPGVASVLVDLPVDLSWLRAARSIEEAILLLRHPSLKASPHATG
jgi:rsbT antagonist protein RsbS